MSSPPAGDRRRLRAERARFRRRGDRRSRPCRGGGGDLRVAFPPRSPLRRTPEATAITHAPQRKRLAVAVVLGGVLARLGELGARLLLPVGILAVCRLAGRLIRPLRARGCAAGASQLSLWQRCSTRERAMSSSTTFDEPPEFDVGDRVLTTETVGPGVASGAARQSGCRPPHRRPAGGGPVRQWPGGARPSQPTPPRCCRGD